MKTLIIDSNSIAARAHFTPDPMTFFSMVNGAIEDIQPDYLIYVFDSPEPSWRKELYSAYKANRPDRPELIQWIEQLKSGFVEAGLLFLEYPEADDMVASIAFESRASGYETYIFSGDKDLWALAGDRIRIYGFYQGPDPFTGRNRWYRKVFSTDELTDQLGFHPSWYPVFKSLYGDTSDNIPGVKWIGDKRARLLIENYFTLDNIFRVAETNPDEILRLPAGKTILEALLNGKKTAYLSYKLATLDPPRLSEFPGEFDFNLYRYDPERIRSVVGLLRQAFFALEQRMAEEAYLAERAHLG